MKKFIIAFGLAVFLPFLSCSAYAPLGKNILQNKVQFNNMLTTYPELREVKIRFVPLFAEKLIVCEPTGDKECSSRVSSYELGNDTIYIFNGINPFHLRYSVIHEYAHHLYFAEMERWERKQWEMLYKESPNHVSRYSRHSSYESFAEWVAVYKYNLRDFDTYDGVEMIFDSPQGKFLDQVVPKYRKPL